MKYLKLFENFDNNKPVIDALKVIASCVEGGEKLSSKLNGRTLMDLHDMCDIEDVREILKAAEEVISTEIGGTGVDLGNLQQLNPEKIRSLIDVLQNKK
jgi:hypothetical protein